MAETGWPGAADLLAVRSRVSRGARRRGDGRPDSLRQSAQPW